MKENNKINFEALVVVDNECAYASSKDFNGLFYVNMSNGECKYISLFDNENVDGKRLHCKAVYYENKIYFIPSSAEYLSVFDLKNYNVKQVKIPVLNKKNIFYSKSYKFTDCYVKDGNIWLIPSTFPGVLKFDLKTEKMIVFDDWVPNKKYFFRKGACICGDKIFIPDTSSNLVLEVDMNNEKVICNYVGDNNKGCWSCYSIDGNNLWFAPKNYGPIFKWSYNENKIVEYKNHLDVYDNIDFLFSKVYAVGNNLFFIPVYADMMIMYDAMSDSIVEVNIEKFYDKDYAEYMFETDLYLYINIAKRDELKGYKISKNTNCITRMDFRFKENIMNYYKEYIENKIQEKKVIKENNIVGFEEYLSGLKIF